MAGMKLAVQRRSCIAVLVGLGIICFSLLVSCNKTTYSHLEETNT